MAFIGLQFFCNPKFSSLPGFENRFLRWPTREYTMNDALVQWGESLTLNDNARITHKDLELLLLVEPPVDRQPGLHVRRVVLEPAFVQIDNSLPIGRAVAACLQYESTHIMTSCVVTCGSLTIPVVQYLSGSSGIRRSKGLPCLIASPRTTSNTLQGDTSMRNNIGGMPNSTTS